MKSRVRISSITDIAWSTNRDVQFPIWTKFNVLPSMRSIWRKVIPNNIESRIIQIVIYILKLQDSIDLSNIKISIFESNSIRHVKTTGNLFDDISNVISVSILDCKDFSTRIPTPGANIKNIGRLTVSHLTGTRNFSINWDFESLWQINIGDSFIDRFFWKILGLFLILGGFWWLKCHNLCIMAGDKAE